MPITYYFKDTLHGCVANSGSQYTAFILIKNECFRLGWENPTYQQIEMISKEEAARLLESQKKQRGCYFKDLKTKT